MPQDRRLVSYRIDEPFDTALRMLRRAIAREGLRVPCEVNTSARLKQELGIGLKSSIVLYVDTPLLMLEATVLNIGASLYVPEPVVLASRGAESVVLVRSIRPLLDDSFQNSVREAILSLHDRIVRAIQTVGQRESVFEPAGKSNPAPALAAAE